MLPAVAIHTRRTGHPRISHPRISHPRTGHPRIAVRLRRQLS